MPNTIGRPQKFVLVPVGIHAGEGAIEDVLASDILDVLLENPNVNVLTDAEYALLTEFDAISANDDDFMQYKSGAWTNRSPTQVRLDLAINNLDNTSDANKPVSIAQQIAIDAKVADNLTSSSTVAPSKDAVNAGLLSYLNTAKAYTDASVVSLWDDRGNYDASVNLFPSTGGSGTAGAILKGDIWNITVAGTLGGVPVVAKQTVRALVDSPAQISSNWAIGLANTDIEDSITDGVTGKAPSQNAVYDALLLKENVANKVTSLSSPDNVNYPTTLAVTSALAFKQDSNALLTDIALLSLSAGDLLYYDGSDIVNLGIGSEGQVLKVTSGLPTWGTGGGGSGRSDAPTTTVNASAGPSVDMMTSKNVEIIMNTNVTGLTCPVDPTEEGTPLVLTVTMQGTAYTMTLGPKFEGGLDNPIPSPFLDATINKSGIYHFAWNRVNAKWTFLGMERKRG